MAPGCEVRGDALERDALPEVGQLMQRVAAVHELDRRAGVFVGEEPGLGRPVTLSATGELLA